MLSPGRPQACWAPRTRARCAWLSGELRVGKKAEASERAGGLSSCPLPGRCVASGLLRGQQWPPCTPTPLRIWRRSLHRRLSFGLRVSATRCPRESPLLLPPCRWARGVCPPRPPPPAQAPRRAGSEPQTKRRGDKRAARAHSGPRDAAGRDTWPSRCDGGECVAGQRHPREVWRKQATSASRRVRWATGRNNLRLVKHGGC